MTSLLFNEQLFTDFFQKKIPETKKYLWIATADIKDIYIPASSKSVSSSPTRAKYVPFLQILAELLTKGREVHLLHAKEPGPRFRTDFDKFPVFLESDLFERILCPRVHFKSIIIDGDLAYTGSANLTGAGLGAKDMHKRNFECGLVTTNPDFIKSIQTQFREVFEGEFCSDCKRRELCPDPIY
jgi:phosphatidylserine/phosphatidylglycerophosphate/cardiolipin synthase-like enzyme